MSVSSQANEALATCPANPERVRACFQAAVEFWHEMLDFEIETWAVDDDIPQYETARDYFHARGFDDEDIDRFQFGWAPGGTALYDHLRDHGFGVNEMLWTGVMSRAGATDYPTAARPGRVVIPYHVDGDPVYAIFRSTGQGGGHPAAGYDGHPGDIQPGKYSKPRKPGNTSALDEPAWGVDYIRDEQPLVITEGVLDAAQAVSHGYSAISPVTTSFSERQKDQFVSLVEGAFEVWIINDNDTPLGENLYEEPLAPGPNGMLKMWEELKDQAEIKLGLPPKPDGVDKVDLDDYLRNGGLLEQIWEQPLDPTDFEWQTSSPTDFEDRDLPPSAPAGKLWSLRLTDVAPVQPGERTENPLRPNASESGSEGYFHVSETGETAYSYRTKETHTAQTYILGLDPSCPSYRDAEFPRVHQGFSAQDKFHLWRLARGHGFISDDEPIPQVALAHIAISEGLCDASEIVDGWKLPFDAYNAALEVLEDRGLEPGRSQLSGAPRFELEECDPPAYEPIPFDREALWQELREEKISDFLNTTADVIWNHPPGSGKTTNAMLGLLDREVEHTILFDKHEKIDEMMEDTEFEFGEEYFHLLGSEQLKHRECREADQKEKDCTVHPEGGCPHMCDMYDLDPEDPRREAYMQVMSEIGPMKAHLYLEPHGEDEKCEWQQQLSRVEHEDYVMGVKEYETLSTVTRDRVVVYDEAPKLPADDDDFTVEEVNKMAQYLTRMHTRGCREFGEFAYQVRDYLLNEVDDLAPPELTSTEGAEIDGVAFESSDAGLLTELVKCKEEYSEAILSNIRRDEWNGERLGFDALLLMAAEAGLDQDIVRRAVAAPLSVRVCPQCGGDITNASVGERACQRCEWREDLDQKARAVAFVDTEKTLLRTEALPVREDLPGKVLVLDATADVRIHRGYFGREPGVVGDVDYEMDLDLTQYLDGQYHYGTIKDGAYERIQPLIDQRRQEHEKVLIAGHKKAKYLFDIDPEHFIHFQGGTKGLNKDEYDHVVVIGANHIPPDAARRQAELLGMDTDMDPGGVEQSTRREAPEDAEMRTYIFEDETGRGRQGHTKTYSGLTGVVFEQRREKEIEQAVHRIRPLLYSKSADLVTNVRTELPVTRFARLDEFKPNPCEQVLGHFDGEFTIEMVSDAFDVTERTARSWLQELKERDEIEEIDGFRDVKTYWYT